MYDLRRLWPIAWLCLALMVLLCVAPAAHADGDFLDPSDAFRFSATERAGEVDVHFAIADGYYMYRERFAFKVGSGQATLGAPVIPAGHVKFDDTFQKNVETYTHEVTVRVPVKAAAGPFDLIVTGQGCAEKGICYPPTDYPVHVSGVALHVGAPQSGDGMPVPAVSTADQAKSDSLSSLLKPRTEGRNDLAMSRATGAPDGTTVSQRDAPTFGTALSGGVYDEKFARDVLEQRGVPAALVIFFALGIALSLLPCSLPMIPILSAVIVGEGEGVTRRRGFALALMYVLGMAIVYAVFGVAAGLLGQGLAAWLQNAWVLGFFALLLTVFALSLLGCFELQLPRAWQDRMHGVSQRQRGGKLAAVFGMGAVSALVVGACMTAPLFGVLAFVAHTGNALFGGAALFAMALGIGVPLLLVGLGAGTLLPRAGRWMETVKRLLGVVLLAAAWWMVVPVLPPAAALLGAALWLLVGAVVLGLFDAWPAGGGGAWQRVGKALGALLALCAAILTVGAAAGSQDIFHPLAVLAARAPGAAPADDLPFAPVRSTAQLEHAVGAAGRVSMLDFYADWCVSCKEMEKLTFTDARVREQLRQLNRLRADVTANDPDDRALLKRFGLFGPPGIIFFDAQGREIQGLRVIGYQNAANFLATLRRVAGG